MSPAVGELEEAGGGNPTRGCPGGCGAQVFYVKFACHRCWFRLPRRLRRALNTTWVSYSYSPRPDSLGEAAILAALDWYRANPL